MARPAGTVTKVFFLWGFDDSVLTYGILSGRRYAERTRRMIHLEHELLPLLLATAKRGVRAVVVVPEELHGFAASRLILTAVNTICWMLDIPVLSAPGTWRTAPDKLRERIGDRLDAKAGFTGPVLPQYDRPANITRSKRPRSFTIT